MLTSETFDVGRHAAFVEEHGEPGLEVGCGDGHPILDLLAKGLDLDGVESSPDMIERARSAAWARGLKVDLHVARREDMGLGRRYRCIYLAGPTFELLPDDVTARRALEAFRRHLAPGGTIMILLWIPSPTPACALGLTREATDEARTLLRLTPLSEEFDAIARTRRTSVGVRLCVGDASTTSMRRQTWVSVLPTASHAGAR